MGGERRQEMIDSGNMERRTREETNACFKTQMNIKDDMKAQMRAWDEGKKMTLLRQQRNSIFSS